MGSIEGKHKQQQLKMTYKKRTQQMRKSTIFSALFIVATLLLLGCSGQMGSSSPEDAPPVKKHTQLPVTQIIQTMNLPYHQTWRALLAVLKELNIPSAVERKNDGRLTSEWIPIHDTLCGSYPHIPAPLDCKVRYFVALQSINKQASVVTIRYVERCEEKKNQPFECPNSNAEKLMKKIIAKLRASAETAD